MVQENKRINVSDLDFDNIKINLRDFLSGQEEFKDYNFEGSGLSVILDILAYNTHYQALYQNLAINELFLDSASKRDSVVSISKMLGYTPRSARCARAIVNITFPSNVDDEPTRLISKFSKFTTSVDNRTYTFQTTENLTTELTSRVNDNGDMIYEYVFKDVEITEGFVITNAIEYNEGQRFTIPNANIDIETLKVRVQENGDSDLEETYTRATNLLELDSESNVYFIKEIENGYYEILFGDGVIGKRLNSGNLVKIEVIASSLDVPNNANSFVHVGGGIVTTTTDARGGGQKETIESIKANAPNAYASQNRAITPNDYKSLLFNKFPYIKAMSIWGGEDNIPAVYGRVFIVIGTFDGELLTQTQKNDIINYLRTKSTLTISTEIVDPSYLNIILRTTVYYDGRTTALGNNDIELFVRNAIGTYNRDNLENFDGVLRYSNLLRAIDDAHESIINDETILSLQANINPLFNILQDYTLIIGNEIDEDDFTVESNGFKILGSDETYYFDNLMNGNLRLYRRDASNNKIIVNSNAGSVNFNDGIVTINSINITELIGSELTFDVKPKSNDVTSSLNNIIQIDTGNLNIDVVRNN